MNETRIKSIAAPAAVAAIMAVSTVNTAAYPDGEYLQDELVPPPAYFRLGSNFGGGTASVMLADQVRPVDSREVAGSATVAELVARRAMP